MQVLCLKRIFVVKDEMNDATSSAHSIRANIQETRFVAALLLKVYNIFDLT